jgi:hypothetical protein
MGDVFKEHILEARGEQKALREIYKERADKVSKDKTQWEQWKSIYQEHLDVCQKVVCRICFKPFPNKEKK